MHNALTRRARAASAAGLGVALGLAALFAGASPASAAGLLSFEAQAGGCYYSYQDTDSTTGLAYAILEANPGADCELVLRNADDSVLADVQSTGSPAVIYFAAAGSYLYELYDNGTGSGALASTDITGIPVVPVLPGGSATVGTCQLGLENRVITGHLATYSTGWNIAQSLDGSNCINAATSTSQTTTNTVQVALVDPFGVTFAKSVVTPASDPVAGDAVTFQFTVTNSGGMPLSFTLDDPLSGLGAIDCPATVVAAAATVVCTAQYTVQAADITAGSVTNTATMTAVDDAQKGRTGATLVPIQSTVIVTLHPTSTASPATTAQTTALASTGIEPWMPLAIGLLLIALGTIVRRYRRA